jgi:bacterioferritin-associated ferredoxin
MKIDRNDPVLDGQRALWWFASSIIAALAVPQGPTVDRRSLFRLYSQECAVIVCSCNVLSDGEIISAVTSAAPRARISQVYASLGCAAKCGRCACTIKIILKEIGSFATAEHAAWRG